MVLEVALLKVKKGQEKQFELDFERDGQFISSINHSCTLLAMPKTIGI